MKFDTSSKVSITNDTGSVQFKCPNCLKQVIFRSLKSRQIVVQYTCSECGFVGPN